MSKWKLVGTGFGLRSSKLKEIEKAHPNDLTSCLLESITTWSERNYNTKKFGEPTWRRVVEVVNDPAFGANPSLARTIIASHKSISTFYTIVVIVQDYNRPFLSL